MKLKSQFLGACLAISGLSMVAPSFAEGEAGAPTKLSRKEARKACKAEHPGVKGKEIKLCVKEKLSAQK